MGQPLIHARTGLANHVLLASPVTVPLMTSWMIPDYVHTSQTGHARA